MKLFIKDSVRKLLNRTPSSRVEGVYAVISMPYSGSTILSFLLGSHSRIYNGSDLHHLNPERRGECSIHKSACDVWTKEALDDVYAHFKNINDWYEHIAKVTGRPIICDASKQLSFYRDALTRCNKPLALILLKKHPMRNAASDVYNRWFAKQVKLKNIEEIHSYMEHEFDQVLEFVDKRMLAFINHYEERAELVEMLEKRDNIVDVKEVTYEYLVSDTEDTLNDLLGVFNLAMEPGQMNYVDFEHHPITGNMGPVWKTREAASNNKQTHKKDFRKGYYMNNESLIFLDNKYAEIFNPGQIEAIQGLGSYRKLLSDLRYDAI